MGNLLIKVEVIFMDIGVNAEKIIVNKIVVLGWNNFTASLIDGIKSVYPQCEVLCPDISPNDFEIARKFSYLNECPLQMASIYEDADIVIIDKNMKETISLIQNIKPFLETDTYIIDFQQIKTVCYEKITSILDRDTPYISCFVFLDAMPDKFTIRGNLFKDKIAAVVCDTSTPVLQRVRDFWNIVGVKIVPTTAEFFDEIIAETIQGLLLLSSSYIQILQQDSWSDTLFFGFYNKNLREFMSPICNDCQKSAENIIQNGDYIRRTLSFIKREVDKIDEIIDNEDVVKMTQYLSTVQKFRDRV